MKKHFVIERTALASYQLKSAKKQNFGSAPPKRNQEKLSALLKILKNR
jgi:hypothetical protein